MTKENNLIKIEIIDALQECISVGLEKAAKVIGELVDSDVSLTTAKIYLADNETQFPIFSNRIIIQEMIGNTLSGKTIFSMGDDELIKLIKYLEGFDEIDIEDEESLELLLDTYHELGNIILGNIISSMVDFLDLRVEIKVPYLTTKNIFDFSYSMQFLIVDVLFKINKLDIEGKLFLVNDYNTYLNLIELANK
jgi:chemotaxis protein CheY-P-specific phosphatase CheC